MRRIGVDKEIFREYDIRGEVGETLTGEDAVRIGRGFGTYLKERGGHSVALGRDNRLSSHELQGAAMEGLLSTGCRVYDVGQLPTPAFYFSVMHYKADGGIMVTASHNPPRYNGFKMRLGETAVFGEEIQKIASIIESGRYAAGTGSSEARGIVDEYLAAIKARIRLKRRLKVVADAGNGTAGPLAARLLEELGCDLVELYCEPDGAFPHHLPDPTVDENVAELSARVREAGADAGVAYDGDADRLGAVDEQGAIVRGDQLLSLFAAEVLARNPAPVVFDVKCSEALIETITRAGGTPVMWKTGYPNIQAKMKEVHAPVGGEMSGHFYFMDDYFGFDDGIFASCRLLQLLSNAERPLSALVRALPVYWSTPEIRAECTEEEKFGIVKDLVKQFGRQYQTIDIDGIRIRFEDGWALIRASNTQPILVLRFEAKTRGRMEEIKELVREKLSRYPSVKLDF
jgi:phosphomannomutase/phosphoglucomutase